MMRRTGTAATLLAALLSLALAGQALGVTWSTALKASDDPMDFLMPDRSLATAAGVTHLVWVDDADGDLLYRRSTNLGGTWAPKVQLSPNSDTVSVLGAAVAAYGDTVVVVYRTRSTTKVNALYIRRSVDKGVHWMARVTLQSFTASAYLGAPSVAMSSSGIHVAWTDTRNGKVFYSRSVDGGSTYLPRVQLAVTTRTSLNARPSVAASSTRVYVAWSPADSATCGGAVSSLVMRRSVDGGATFKPVQTIDSRDQYELPALSASGAVLLATYTLCGPQRVVVARSADSGATFARSTIATSTTTTAYRSGDAFISGTAARLVYSSSTATTDRLLLRTSGDGGATWSTASTAANRVGIYAPQVVGTTTAVLVAYQVWIEPSSIGIFTRKGVL